MWGNKVATFYFQERIWKANGVSSYKGGYSHQGVIMIYMTKQLSTLFDVDFFIMLLCLYVNRYTMEVCVSTHLLKNLWQEHLANYWK